MSPKGQRIHQESLFHGHPAFKYLEDFVYGGIDGAVTTFAVVAGVQGASLASSIVIILGIANLMADGFSMAVGNYLSGRAKSQRYDRMLEREDWEIDNLPDREVEEIRDIFRKKGFEGHLLEEVTKKITSKRDVWLDTMMVDELGMIRESKTPIYAALTTFVAFSVVGSIPLIPYVGGVVVHLKSPDYFLASILMTGIALGIVGWIKGMVVGLSKIRGAVETMLVGGIAAAVSYTVGYLLKSLAG